MFNVVRSTTVPPSLAACLSYRDDDVLKQLKNDFHDKCYLCELKEPNDVQVEHFRPHSKNPELKFEWTNLFYVCSRCNNIKLSGFENILDCTSQNVDVFKSVKLLPPVTPKGILVTVEAMDDAPETVQTVELLKKIYNEPNTDNKRITAAYLRTKVFTKYNRLLELMTEYYSEEKTKEQKHDALCRIRVLMGKEQEFSAFLRWVVLEDEKLKPILELEMN